MSDNASNPYDTIAALRTENEQTQRRLEQARDVMLEKFIEITLREDTDSKCSACRTTMLIAHEAIDALRATPAAESVTCTCGIEASRFCQVHSNDKEPAAESVDEAVYGPTLKQLPMEK